MLTTMKSTRNNQEETMKVHTLASTDTQTNIREELTQTVQIRFSLRLLRLIGYTALLGTMGVSASWADNCTGYDAGVTQSAETTDLGHGLKQTSVRSTSMLFSNDSMYNLAGGECAAIVLQTEDGKLNKWGTAPATIRMATPIASLSTKLPVPTRASGSQREERASLQERGAQVGSKMC